MRGSGDVGVTDRNPLQAMAALELGFFDRLTERYTAAAERADELPGAIALLRTVAGSPMVSADERRSVAVAQLGYEVLAAGGSPEDAARQTLGLITR